MKQLKLMCLTGVFTAAVFVLTGYLHIPSHTGYTHVGDGLIYLAACMLPLPYAAFVGACGAALADCLTGFAIWAPGSIVIKTVAVLFFTRKSREFCGAPCRNPGIYHSVGIQQRAVSSARRCV